MTVYVVMEFVDAEAVVIGVYASLDAAKAATPATHWNQAAPSAAEQKRWVGQRQAPGCANYQWHIEAYEVRQ